MLMPLSIRGRGGVSYSSPWRSSPPGVPSSASEAPSSLAKKEEKGPAVLLSWHTPLPLRWTALSPPPCLPASLPDERLLILQDSVEHVAPLWTLRHSAPLSQLAPSAGSHAGLWTATACGPPPRPRASHRGANAPGAGCVPRTERGTCPRAALSAWFTDERAVEWTAVSACCRTRARARASAGGGGRTLARARARASAGGGGPVLVPCAAVAPISSEKPNAAVSGWTCTRFNVSKGKYLRPVSHRWFRTRGTTEEEDRALHNSAART